jgi:dihydroorotase-like cyclic amidohydrolase
MADMPLNSLPPTTTVENLFVKVNAAKEQSYVDVGFHGGVIPGNAEHLVPLHKAGVKGFKCFMIESGVLVSLIRRLMSRLMNSHVSISTTLPRLSKSLR